MSINSIKASLIRKLQSIRYRRSFANAHVGTQIALQLRALRRSRPSLSQEKLAKEIGMKQARISVLENPDYQNYNIKTLKRIAEFYDVVLDVRFLSFREFVDLIVRETPDDFAPPPFGIAYGLPDKMLEPVQGRFGKQGETSIDSLIPESRDPLRFSPLQEPLQQ